MVPRSVHMMQRPEKARNVVAMWRPMLKVAGRSAHGQDLERDSTEASKIISGGPGPEKREKKLKPDKYKTSVQTDEAGGVAQSIKLSLPLAFLSLSRQHAKSLSAIPFLSVTADKVTSIRSDRRENAGDTPSGRS